MCYCYAYNVKSRRYVSERCRFICYNVYVHKKIPVRFEHFVNSKRTSLLLHKSKHEAFEAAQPFAVPSCDEFAVLMFLNKNFCFYNAEGGFCGVYQRRLKVF